MNETTHWWVRPVMDRDYAELARMAEEQVLKARVAGVGAEGWERQAADFTARDADPCQAERWVLTDGTAVQGTVCVGEETPAHLGAPQVPGALFVHSPIVRPPRMRASIVGPARPRLLPVLLAAAVEITVEAGAPLARAATPDEMEMRIYLAAGWRIAGETLRRGWRLWRLEIEPTTAARSSEVDVVGPPRR